MSSDGLQHTSAPQGAGKCRWRAPAAGLALAAAIVTTLALGAAVRPGVAQAHGPVAPLASDWLARLSSVPAGLQARVVDGDQRMWLQVPAQETVVVLDYRGAPYLRFSPPGVAVNQNSEMYYLNQTPVAETPPAGLTARTPPSWHSLSAGHTYGWHDGRLHALASVALAPGASYAGRWQVPLILDGARADIAGGLWRAGAPSLIWFWPVLVVVLCLVAGLRLRRTRFDALAARTLALASLLAVAVASAGHELHGRPTVGAFGVVELGVILGLVAWGLVRVLRRSAGFLTYFVIAFVTIWEGITVFSTLTRGFVLMAVPAFVGRTAAVVCLAGGLGLLLVSFRLAERSDRSPDRRSRRPAGETGFQVETPV